MVWNCDGITNKTVELNAFIKQNDINTTLLEETRLNLKTTFKILLSYIPQRPPPKTQNTTVKLIHRKIIHH